MPLGITQTMGTYYLPTIFQANQLQKQSIHLIIYLEIMYLRYGCGCGQYVRLLL